MDTGRASDEAPPAGTAIARPLRHVRAVRERSLERFAGSAEAAASRSARAWAWALGEGTISPVTDRQTVVPPSRPEIEAEIAEADRRRLSGSRENRADGAATVLRWLIGDDDHVPVRGPNPGALVGGSGDIVRSRAQVARVMELAVESQQQAEHLSGSAYRNPRDRQLASQDTAYFSGVAATLAWVLRYRLNAPITDRKALNLTTRDLKVERVHAEDQMEQAARPDRTSCDLPPHYGEGVRSSIAWLLGDTTEPASCGVRRSS